MSRNVIANLFMKLRALLSQTASRLARSASLPAIRAKATDVTLDRSSPFRQSTDMTDAESEPRTLSSLHDAMTGRMSGSPPSPRPTLTDLEHPTDMNASVDTLAEQMLTLVEIVSAQERDLKSLKERCRKLEEHDQAIMVAFTTFFHVLAAGRVAKLSEISGILQNITKVAEQEGRPREAVRFLQDLATMLPEHTAEEPHAGGPGQQPNKAAQEE